MGEHTKYPDLMMAGSIVTIIPVIIVFLVLQKYYVRGLMMEALKNDEACKMKNEIIL